MVKKISNNYILETNILEYMPEGCLLWFTLDISFDNRNFDHNPSFNLLFCISRVKILEISIYNKNHKS